MIGIAYVALWRRVHQHNAKMVALKDTIRTARGSMVKELADKPQKSMHSSGVRVTVEE